MSVLDEKVVADLRDLIGDDYLSVFKAFLRTADQGMLDLAQAVDTGDMKRVESITHTLKGSSANIGAKTLSRLSANALGDVRNAATAGLGEHLKNITAEYERVKCAINALM